MPSLKFRPQTTVSGHSWKHTSKGDSQCNGLEMREKITGEGRERGRKKEREGGRRRQRGRERSRKGVEKVDKEG